MIFFFFFVKVRKNELKSRKAAPRISGIAHQKGKEGGRKGERVEHFSIILFYTNNKIQKRRLVRFAVVIFIEAFEAVVRLQVFVRQRILDKRHMTEHVLIWHLNGVSSLRTNLLDRTANVRRADVLESRYANVERDESS